MLLKNSLAMYLEFAFKVQEGVSYYCSKNLSALKTFNFKLSRSCQWRSKELRELRNIRENGTTCTTSIQFREHELYVQYKLSGDIAFLSLADTVYLVSRRYTGVQYYIANERAFVKNVQTIRDNKARKRRVAETMADCCSDQ